MVTYEIYKAQEVVLCQLPSNSEGAGRALNIGGVGSF